MSVSRICFFIVLIPAVTSAALPNSSEIAQVECHQGTNIGDQGIVDKMIKIIYLLVIGNAYKYSLRHRIMKSLMPFG